MKIIIDTPERECVPVGDLEIGAACKIHLDGTIFAIITDCENSTSDKRERKILNIETGRTRYIDMRTLAEPLKKAEFYPYGHEA